MWKRDLGWTRDRGLALPPGGHWLPTALGSWLWTDSRSERTTGTGLRLEPGLQHSGVMDFLVLVV